VYTAAGLVSSTASTQQQREQLLDGTNEGQAGAQSPSYFAEAFA
jgi:hypothetical protein